MAAQITTPAIQTQGLTPSEIKPWDKSRCTDENIKQLVVQIFTKLSNQYQVRIELAKDNYEVLNTGFWHYTDYIKLLHHHINNGEGYAKEVCKQRLSQIIQNKDCIYGYPPVGFSRQERSPFNITYSINEDITPSDAVRNLWKDNSYYFIDCQLAVQLTYYTALSLIFGEKRFDEIFSRKTYGIPSFRLSQIFSYTILRQFTEFNDRFIPKNLKPKFGEHYYIQNFSQYNSFCFFDHTRGFHVICTEENNDRKLVKFSAFGLPLDSTYQSTLQHLVKELFDSIPTKVDDIMPAEDLLTEQERNALKNIEDERNRNYYFRDTRNIEDSRKRHREALKRKMKADQEGNIDKDLLKTYEDNEEFGLQRYRRWLSAEKILAYK